MQANENHDDVYWVNWTSKIWKLCFLGICGKFIKNLFLEILANKFTLSKYFERNNPTFLHIIKFILRNSFVFCSLDCCFSFTATSLNIICRMLWERKCCNRIELMSLLFIYAKMIFFLFFWVKLIIAKLNGSHKQSNPSCLPLYIFAIYSWFTTNVYLYNSRV